MRVVAGTPHGVAFLVELDDGEFAVVDRRRRRLYAARREETVLARGRWVEFTGDPQPIFDLLTKLQEPRQTD